MKKLYLGVGINAYAQSPLRGCVNDIQDLFKFLVEQYAFKPGDNMRLLLNERATTQTIRDRMDWMRDKAQRDDICAFQDSSHGSQVPTRSDSGEVDGMDEIICPYDFNWDGNYITDNEIGQWVVDIRSKGAFPIVIIDACHSGTITRNFGLPFDIQPIFFEPVDLPDDLRIKYGFKISIPWGVRYLAPPLDIMARMTEGLRPRKSESIYGAVISGCQDNQTSADAYIDGRFNGAMTRCLIDILANDVDKKFTWGDLNTLLQHKVKARNFSQIPQVVFEDGEENRLLFN